MLLFFAHWQVMGLNTVPLAGDGFEIVGSLDLAREKAESRAEYLRNEHIAEKEGDGKVTLSSLASAVSSGKNAGLDLHQLNVILKVDVQVCICYAMQVRIVNCCTFSQCHLRLASFAIKTILYDV